MLRRMPNSRELRVIRRLRSAGCPVDYEHLPKPPCPLRNVMKTTIQGGNLVPTAGGYVIAFGIKALACTALSICRFELRADWFTQQVSWLRPCEQHGRKICFHARTSKRHDPQFSSGNLLTSRTWLLKRGDYLAGVLFGALHESLPPTLPENLEVTVHVEDLAGYEYSFPVLLENTVPKAVLKQPIGEPW